MTTEINYLGNHFPPEIIRQAIWPQTHDFRLFMPARLARRRLQHFNAPPLIDRVIATLAAS